MCYSTSTRGTGVRVCVVCAIVLVHVYWCMSVCSVCYSTSTRGTGVRVCVVCAIVLVHVYWCTSVCSVCYRVLYCIHESGT